MHPSPRHDGDAPRTPRQNGWIVLHGLISSLAGLVMLYWAFVLVTQVSSYRAAVAAAGASKFGPTCGKASATACGADQNCYVLTGIANKIATVSYSLIVGTVATWVAVASMAAVAADSHSSATAGYCMVIGSMSVCLKMLAVLFQVVAFTELYFRLGDGRVTCSQAVPAGCGAGCAQYEGKQL